MTTLSGHYLDKVVLRFSLVLYHADADGTAVMYEAVNQAVRSAREERPITADWIREIDEDYEGRKANEPI